MRKRLALIFSLVILSLFGFIGCTKDPYAKLQINVPGINTEEIQQLNIKKTYSGYEYDNINLTVEVTGYTEDMNTEIIVSGWEGYITKPSLEYVGNGRTYLKSEILKVGEGSTGKFTLHIQTKEGNKSVDIIYNIDLQINDFVVQSDALPAVSSSYEIVLDDIDGMIKYFPEETTQKLIKYAVEIPTKGLDCYEIDGHFDTNYIIEDESLFEEYRRLNYKYAEVVVDEETNKQVLKVYPYLVAENGQRALDASGEWIPSDYPQIQEELTGQMQSVSYSVITLRAHSVSGNTILDKFIDIEVVPNAADVCMEMNVQGVDGASDSRITINKDSNGDYNVVLIDVDNKGGIITADNMAYYSQRTINFVVADNAGNSINDYQVLLSNEDDFVLSDKLPVSISPIGNNNFDNIFTICSVSPGNYTHKFVLEHNTYEGLFTKEIKVNFKVLSIPFRISVNDNIIDCADYDDMVTTVYNTYPRGSYGTKFRVDTKSDFRYCVFYSDANIGDYQDVLTIRRDGDGSKVVFGIAEEQNDFSADIYSSVDGEDFTYFAPKSSFFLSHSMESLPEELQTIYIGITFSMADSSYDENIASTYFIKTLFYFPINLRFENGLESIDFEQEEFKINLNNPKYLYSEDEFGYAVNSESGMKLFDLPVGRTYGNSIKTVTYDKDLIKVYYVHNDNDNRTSFYVKYLQGAKPGRTLLTVESYNGLKESVWVENYISTIYEYNGIYDSSNVIINPQDNPRMPLGCTLDKYSSGFLYYLSGLDDMDHEKGYPVYSNGAANVPVDGITYDSVDTLLMIVKAEQRITFYDYRFVIKASGATALEPIDITNRVRVNFNYTNYATYSNGVIKTNNLVTMDKNTPIIMTISYTSGFESIDAEGKSVYNSLTINHSIKLYIYQPLNGVEITSSKTVDLYLDNSLGYYNKELAQHTIVSTFIPNEIKLGAQWNGAPEWGLDWNPVELWYDYEELLNSEILTSSGDVITIRSNKPGGVDRDLLYKDLFTVTPNMQEYQCDIHNIISVELTSWLYDNGYSTSEAIDFIMRHVYSKDIVFVVDVYIRQFNRYQNINSVKIETKYADRIGELKIDIADDGVYFEIRKDENGNLIPSMNSVEIDYTIDNVDVINKNIAIINYDTLTYFAEVIPNATGNSGKIIITPKVSAGVGNLTLTPEDNVENFDGTNYEFYNSSSRVLQSFRIKVADGSAQYPFEIKDMVDYQQMINDINNGYFYNYVISRDLDMRGYSLNNVDIKNANNKDNTNFSLSGKHSYIRNNTEITIYNSIYNLSITQEITAISNDELNVGLFGVVENRVTLDNISIKSAFVTIIDKANSVKNINVGIIAGKVTGALLNACSVSGSIKVVRYQMNNNIVVGGMAGRVIQNADITNLPGKYEDGIVATGNNAFVDIELTYDKNNQELPNNSFSNKNIVGGLVGLVAKSNIVNVQVVSNITTEIRSTIGGLAGVVGLNTVLGVSNIDNAYIVPNIVANINTTSESVAEDNLLVVGGVIGFTQSSKYKLKNTIVNFLDIGEDGYTWQNRVNIFAFVSNPQDKVAIGGMIGCEYQSAESFQYNYVRSYYEREIDNNYQGNIYVIANSGSVGGIVGKACSGSGITYSYFDGDITASSSLNTGMLVGSVDLTQRYFIQYSYAVGYLNDLDLQQVDVDTYVYKAVPVVVVDGDSGMIGNIGFEATKSGIDVFGNNIALKSNNTSEIIADDSYVVINGNINYFAEGNNIYGIVCEVDETPVTITTMLEVADIHSFLTDKFEYKITLGEDENLLNYQWFWHNSVNTVKVIDQTVAYPLLLKGNMVMYDLVPNSISAKINERDGLYNITYNNMPQVIMYINRSQSGVADNTYYEMSLNNTTSAFEIKLDGAKIFTTYINSNNLKMNDRIEFLENSNESIIKIVGNKIYPVSPGLARLTIRSYVVKSVQLLLDILVVDGITDYSIVSKNTVIEPLPENPVVLPEIPYNSIYIDEQSSYLLNAINKNSNFMVNSSFGFILEIMDASGEIDGNPINNGIIKINGEEKTYDDQNTENNILIVHSRDFKISGVKLGRVSIAITPFIRLNGINYKDTYTSISNSEFSLIRDNMYILNKSIGTHANLQKIYYFNVLARAISIDTNRTEISLDSNNRVSFTTIIETANLLIEQDLVNNKAEITILENLEININNSYTSELNLSGITMTFDINGDTYVCNNDTFASGDFNYSFEYALINFAFKNMSIVMTNIDTEVRNNTYKISLYGNIEFNRDYYRSHAEEFDLNSAEFTITFNPSSNPNISVNSVVKIVPNQISAIFTNFYSKGEGSFNGEQIEFPEENESSFIVPGREGLLKITLDEEFNNSSYVTLTLNRDYLGYINIDQIAAIIDPSENINEVGDIVGYRDIISREQILTDKEFGIRLSKLSLNYNDTNYFNNTYYIKLLVDPKISFEALNLKITSYSVENNVAKEQYADTCSLKIIPLPSVTVTIDDSEYTIMGKGVRKQMNVIYKGLSDNINFSQLNDGFTYISDENGEIVTELDLEYIDSGKKYYLNQDVTTPSGKEYNIDFVASEVILGVIEECRCSLMIDVVDFEIVDVLVCGTKDNGVLNLKFGQNMRLETKINIRDIEVGNSEDIENYKTGELLSLIEKAQFEFAGTTSYRFDNNLTKVELSYGDLKLYKRQMIGSKYDYILIEEGTHGGITIIKDIYSKNDITYEYYEIIGTEISKDTYIKLDYPHYYRDGKLIVGSDAMYVYGSAVNIQVVVENNSTYDHPTPVEDQAKLESICNIEGGNFILVNNIELIDWVPQAALFDTLDGNGYTIKIESFDFSSVRGASRANVGLFTEISSKTLLKNITIDISPLLKNDTELMNDVALMRASNKNGYVHRNDIIDLGYITELNFGVLAGVNKGAITNAKIVSTTPTELQAHEDKYLHILTTQGYDGKTLITSNIGGIVGLNDETGAITNSFLGVNVSNQDNNNYYIESVKNPSVIEMDNEDDELALVQIYPFVLAGGNNLGGLACINNGIISNSYAKGLGLYNTFPTVGESATAGLVTFNNNVITSTFVEGNLIEAYRAKDNEFRLESTGYIGGLVYENNAIIENSYTNAFVQTLSSFIGGFVFVNNSSGTITNCYSTAVNRNSLAMGQFTGVKQGVLQNFGIFTNCYYLVDGAANEFANVNEDAIAINNADAKFDDMSSWDGYSFASGVNIDGIWTIEQNTCPRLASTLIDTISFRRLIETVVDVEGGNGVTFNYIYDTYYLGTKENPLIIDKAENFDKYIIDSAYELDTDKVFGIKENDIRYVRIVNNLDFEKITTAVEHKGMYLYEVVFAGVLDGNGMSLSNLNINTDSSGLESFGLFAQIGHEKAYTKAIVKNVNFGVRTFKSNGNKRTGILAGTIVNSSIVNVNINGGNQTISGLNMSGALAGLIYATEDKDITIVDVTVENVRIESTHGSLGGAISERSEDKSQYFFNSFSIEKEGQQSSEGYSFASLYNSGSRITELETIGVSYAGGVAGVICANNYNKDINIDQQNKYNQYRTKPGESTIDNILVRGNIVLSTADNSGGLFGYVAEKTLIKNSKFEVSEGQLLKGFNNIGGIVGENHGIIEQCTVEHVQTGDDGQLALDSTILSNNRNNGTFNLFDMQEGEPYYVVSIGGIAGYSENGSIIDSYSKVNVTKKLSYIAGGIIGYARGYNYLGHVFNTGAVYGKFVTGGIIGLQVNDYSSNEITNKLHMDNVISLTNWNASSTNLNIRDEITKILYDNQKKMYSKSDSIGFDNFFIKMPEVGNIPVNNYYDNTEQKLINNKYRTSHTNYYVGSVVGKALLKNNCSDSIYNASAVSGDTYHVFNNYDILTNDGGLYYGVINGVFSATLGLVSTEGAIESGTRVDHFDKTSFSISLGEDSTINSLSYRIAYKDDDDRLNSYDLIDGLQGDNLYLDKFDYGQIFTAQEYIQQILGCAYSMDGNASSSTLNIFHNGYNVYNRSSVGEDIGKFINTVEQVWEMDDYLPKYSNGVLTSVVDISDVTQLENAFKNGTSGKSYNITVDEIEMSLDDPNLSVKYFAGNKSLFVGRTYNNGETKSTINITLNSGTNLSTIFNLLSGAVFQNIIFNIKVEKSSLYAEKIDGKNYGIFANTLDGVQINNCEFNITIENAVGGEINAEGQFEAENVGLLFGAVNNSTIVNTSFNINLGTSVSLNNVQIRNFGLLSGSMSRSTFNGCTVNLNNSDKVIIIDNVCLKEVNVGGLVGSVYGSKFNNLTLENVGTIKISDKEQVDNKSIGALFGYANQLNWVGGSDMLAVPSLTYETSIQLNTCNLNIALVVGRSEESKLSNLVLNNDCQLNVADGNSYIADELNIGSIIGIDVKNSTLGNSGVVGSYASITSGLMAYMLNAGGIVGKSISSNQLFNNVFAYNNLNITNNNPNHITKSETITDEDGNPLPPIDTISFANTYVGGLIGLADGKIGLDNVVSDGSINLNINECIDGGKQLRAVLGGLIGCANGIVKANNFVSIVTLTLNKTDYEFTQYETYISGILGYNNGIFSGSNGYSYVELPRGSSVRSVTSGVTNGIIGACENVYYAQEFVGNNYSSDINFACYAMGDLYNSLSEYSRLYTLQQQEGMDLVDIGNIQLVVPTTLKDYIIENASVDVGGNKFNLYNIVGHSSGNMLKSYNVISEDIDNCAGWSETVGQTTYWNKIESNMILSGRSTESGKVKVGISENIDATTTYFVNTNNGVLSNLYLITTTGTDTANNHALVDQNNGIITNVMVYGLSRANHTLAKTNNGYIYSSVSSIKYLPSCDDDQLYGLVVVNEESGVISDCYSNSFAYTESLSYTTDVYGFAKDNFGKIEYSTYYIHSTMEYDNINKDFAYELADYVNPDKVTTDKINASIISNCYNKESPSNLLQRSMIWYEENNHAQIIGIKDIVGGIVTRIMISIGQGTPVEIENVADLKDKISGNYKLSYEYEFYVSSLPSYNVIRVSQESDLINYIDSLHNGYIPAETIILFTNNFSNAYDHIIKIDASKLNKISLTSTSAIIGINTKEGATNNIILDFEMASNKGVMDHEFINTNNGLVAGIDIYNLEMRKSKTGMNFAPIVNNNGIINNVNFNNISVKGIGTAYVAGLVATNTGKIYNVNVDGVYIYSLQWVSKICIKNTGIIDTHYVIVENIMYDGDMYYGGI